MSRFLFSILFVRRDQFDASPTEQSMAQRIAIGRFSVSRSQGLMLWKTIMTPEEWLALTSEQRNRFRKKWGQGEINDADESMRYSLIESVSELFSFEYGNHPLINRSSLNTVSE